MPAGPKSTRISNSFSRIELQFMLKACREVASAWHKERAPGVDMPKAMAGSLSKLASMLRTADERHAENCRLKEMDVCRRKVPDA